MKDFIIIGTLNAVTYKVFFPSVRDGLVRMGYTKRGGDKISYTALRGGVLTVCNSCWWTTLPSFIPPPLDLKEEYTPDKYPKYDDYEAIEVSKSKNIPYGYNGMFGVPLSYLRIWNEEQFCIKELVTPKIDGEYKYKRLLIKRK